MLRNLLACVVLSGMLASAQLTYSSGQSVYPAYEGWDRNSDGTFNIVFGYMNSNWEEELDVPIGPGNNIEPAGPDQGQPTHFFPRRNRFIFKVRVPADFGEKELVWTLTTHGKTVKAYGTLKQDFFLDNIVYSSETGALGAGLSSPEVRANKPPVLEAIGESVRQVKLGQTLTLSAHVTDDGVPRVRSRAGAEDRKATNDLRLLPPRQITVGSSTGLWVSCLLYRAPMHLETNDQAKVAILPPQVKSWEDTRAGANSQWAPRWVAPPAPADGKWTVQVTFDQPGQYMLRWHASDGALWVDQDITVNVTR